MTPRIRELAREVTATAQTPYDKAVALQRWFTRDGGFTYSTSVKSGADADYIAEFLEERVGYCEQFAASMAIMARSLGIPSRVVVGFTQGTRDEDGVWHVTVRDAHAWPELWFEGVGWARFEPTPRSGATVFTPEYARTADGDIPQGGRRHSRPARRRGLRPGRRRAARPSCHSRSARSPCSRSLVALLLLAVPMARRLVRRRRRLHARQYAAVVDGAWAEVGDLAVDHGQPWSEFSTPRQAAERLSRGMASRPPQPCGGFARRWSRSGTHPMRAQAERPSARRRCVRTCGWWRANCAPGCGGRPGSRPTAGRPPSDGASGPPCDP